MNVSRESLEKLKAYEALLHKWQKAVNLVSPNTLNEAWTRHFEDSLQLLPVILSVSEESKNPSVAALSHDDKKPLTLFDLGSGAGFPGLVLAIARPDINVHLVESDSKKCSFLKTVSRESSTPVTVHTARIESVDSESVPDVITARALASLDKLLGWCAKWADENPDLTMIFLKGEKTQEEITEARLSYSFDCKIIDSKTDPSGKILVITNLKS
ncbi:MAG: 16S rRNA (guanine(527)-N(7))-methyltransferase RsmG [Rhodospirillales bacterium]|nr:16S rRNA (guanine(527)-N(7))-methyltransferase RsmG [Rhodospirillales bacterium]